ncbi:unnamed protein product [Phyllotreta striolata]|uniref:C2H2-type domain-containing protein n=1 Tax=Phyllotreta striolata TaxID=444603 RepID=A0A9N9XSZ6_PHYSR|nr:unnamed protein product [Phyllotreta striolata]
MNSKLPLVVILGATGAGKTKLSLELAKKFNGEIIGADSMQVYKGLDIITAKATKQEQSVAPHHLIDVLEPSEMFTVAQYKTRALRIIDNLYNNHKLPVIVGGTNYYIESLLWKILIDDDNYTSTPGILPNNDHELPSEELHKKLKELDPVTARRLHPNNKRKILRSLEILYKKGKKHSEILQEQISAKDASKSGGGLRFPHSLVLWLQCDQDILDKRLDDRVNSMIEQGLLQELLDFHRTFQNETPDYTKGIFQSIGFKEFHSYLMMSEEDRRTDDGEKALNEGIEQLKMVTRRYARKQKKWIRNRFLGRQDRKVPPVFGLDTSDVSKWDQNVSRIAEEIVNSFISNSKCPHNPLPKQITNSAPNIDSTTNHCDICNRVFIGDFQWTTHINSNRHKREMAAKRKKDAQSGE